MARIDYSCIDCGEKFNQHYLFFKTDKVKCPSCGSVNVKEETSQGSSCGCGSQGSNAGRFT